MIEGMKMYYIVVFCLFPLVWGQFMPGGTMPQNNLQDEKLQQMASFVASNFSAERNMLLTVGDNVELIGAKTQVVSGIKYYLKLRITTPNTVEVCDVQVWEQVWLKHTEIVEQQCHPVMGARHPVAVTAKVKAAAAFAADRLNEKSNGLYYNCLTEIRNPTSQLVSGEIFTMDMVMSESTVRKHGPQISSTDGCQLNTNSRAKQFICRVEVALLHPWLEPEYVLRKSKCKGINNEEKKISTVDLLNKEKLDVKTEKIHLLGGDDHDVCNGGMFAEFKQRHNKVYASMEEEKKRYAIFCENMKKVEELQKNERGSARYGATIFADLSPEEFKKYRNNGEVWDLSDKAKMKQANIPKIKDIPENFDWRTHNVVTPVKNQGSCGSCWAFSTTGNIEGQWALKKKNLISLSEQELVDCDKKDQGCEGGLPSNAYKEIIRLGGLETEKEYEYEGRDETCHFKKSEVKVYINSSEAISTNETEIAAWLYKNGPISIGINANAMQFYFGGISHPWKIFCNPESLDHGVLIVGYGVRDKEPYWIIKNSWGESWGEKGYYLVYRGDGVCGLNRMCTSSIVD